MPIAQVQYATTWNASPATTVEPEWGSDTTAGNLLVAMIVYTHGLSLIHI